MLRRLHFFFSQNVYSELKDVAKLELSKIFCATSRVAECFMLLFNIFPIIDYSEQSFDDSLNDFVMLRAREKPHILHCVNPKRNDENTYFLSHTHRKYFCCHISGFNLFSI